MKTKNIAVILAAGSGQRSGFDTPKQMMKLAGKPLVEHTISAFQNCKSIHEIIIVTSANCIEKIEEIVSSQAFNKVKKIVKGGLERFESSVAAIDATEDLSEEFDVRLIFHDAVRPLVSNRIIQDVVSALDHYNAVDVVVPTTDTIISADPITNTINSVPVRATLRNGQTPQGFALKTIKLAYKLALNDPDFKTTDDCGVVLKYLPEEKIFLVEGENNNIKLTYKDDLHIIDKLLQLNTKKTISNNLNTHSLAGLKNKVIVIIGGTSGIGAEMAQIANAYQAKVEIASRRTGTDITNVESVNTEFKRIFEKHGQIDYVVNAAAVLIKQPLVLMDYKDIQDVIQINYIGAIHVALAAHPYLKESRGHLLNFTSSSYTYGRAFYSLYSSSKAAIVNLTQALAEEWHSQFIRINCINPERTDTPMRRRAFGIEPPETLLSAKSVALLSLGVLLDDATGQILDVTSQFVKKAINNGVLINNQFLHDE